MLTPNFSLPTSDELQVKIESPENFMKMRFASSRREDIPACGRVIGNLLTRSKRQALVKESVLI